MNTSFKDFTYYSDNGQNIIQKNKNSIVRTSLINYFQGFIQRVSQTNFSYFFTALITKTCNLKYGFSDVIKRI